MYLAQLDGSALATTYLNGKLFTSLDAARSMIEVYGSDMTGFSEGGCVWAAEMTLNIGAPPACTVGMFL